MPDQSKNRWSRWVIACTVLKRRVAMTQPGRRGDQYVDYVRGCWNFVIALYRRGIDKLQPAFKPWAEAQATSPPATAAASSPPR
jgi:hypothetical protein